MDKPKPEILVQHTGPNRAERRAQAQYIARRRRRGQRAFDRQMREQQRG